ncbi:MAG: zinc-ribbon and DUF3426 domain-containing protein [Burkholderiaceae bacterium]|nr:zinc-ribbon and DUF3426 domain-containing protein [Burkholderiaceae bacterium]
MSLITRCPACTTMFKVVPDQLRVSDGWVRCGQCNEVFDANANLQDAAGEALKPDVAETPAVHTGPVAHEAAVEADEVIKTTDVPRSEPFLAVNPRALHIDRQDSVDELAESDESLSRSMPSAAPTDFPTEPPPPAPEDVPAHSFMRKARSPSRWTRTWVRATLSFAALGLGGALLLQVVIQERDRMVAMEPLAKRYLDPLCEILNCKIEPLRQIESVVIDSSSFTKVRADVYRLSVTLKNAAQIPVATPDLELTLTDMQDQAVVRRVFAAADFTKQHVAMDSGAEIVVTLPVAVKLNAGSERVSGYRLLSFYP